jgi:hypothetical protein
MADSNSDYKVLCNKIDNLTNQVVKNEAKLDGYHTESQKRLAMAEKQLALMEQSYLAICKDIDDNVKPDITDLTDRQDKNDLLTKIITGFQGLLTLALIYLGIRDG